MEWIERKLNGGFSVAVIEPPFSWGIAGPVNRTLVAPWARDRVPQGGHSWEFAPELSGVDG